MSPILRFLNALRSLTQSGAIKSIDEAMDFAKREFGQVNDLLKRQIEQVFKRPQGKAPKPGEGGITSIKNAPKKRDKNNLTDDDPMGDLEKIVRSEGDVGLPNDQASGSIMDQIEASKNKIEGASNRITEIQKEIDAMYKPKPETSPLMERLEKGVDTLKTMKQPGMDPGVGLTRTIARSILNKKGIEVPERVDPIEVLAENFGADVLMDAKNVAEELLELQRMGKGTKSIDEVLEQTGMFDISINKDAPKGISQEQLRQIKKEVDQEKIIKDFDPTDRTENSMGGINRIGYADGPEDPKNKKGIMKVIKKIPKVGKAVEGVTGIIKFIKTLEPIEAMKEVNKVIAKDGPYKNVSDKDTDKIFKDTQDHIFERDPKPSEFDVDFEDGDTNLSQGMIDLDELNFTKDASAAKKAVDDLEIEQARDLAPKMVERLELQQKYPGLDDDLLTAIIDDPDPNNKAQVIGTLEQLMELQRQGKSPEEAVDIIKQTMFKGRKDNSKGGLQYLMGM